MKLRPSLVVIVLVATTSLLYAQQNSLSIGTNQINNKAVLWLVPNASGQGLLLPVVSTAVRNGMGLQAADRGMIVYDNTDNSVYLWNGTAWNNLAGGAATTFTGANGITVTGNTISTDAIRPTTNATGDLSGTFANPQIANNAITTAKIANDAVDNSKIANVNPAKLTQAAATNGQVLKWSGTAWAPADDLTAALTAGTGISIASNVITNTGLLTTSTAAGEVTGTFANLQIANGVVTDVKLADNSVTTAKIANNAVIASKIADGNVTTNKIADNAINTAKVQDANITTPKIADGAVTDAKLATGIAVNKLAPGTNGQVLTVAAGQASWQPAPVGSVPTLSNGQILTGDGTVNSPTTLTGDATLAGGTLTIANNAVTTPKILDASVTNAKVATGIAGTKIIPDFGAQNVLTTGTGRFGITGVNSPTLAGTSLVVGNNSTQAALIDGSMLVNGLVSANGGINVLSTLYADGASGTSGQVLTSNGLGQPPGWTTPGTTVADGSITGGTAGVGVKIAANTITDANIAAGANIAASKLAGTVVLDTEAPAAGDITGNFSTGLQIAANAVTTTEINNLAVTDAKIAGVNASKLSGTITIPNGGTGATTAVAARTNLGLGTLSTLSAVSTTEITDGTIVNNDVSGTAAIAGTKITPAFGAQPISTTGTLSAGATSVSALTVAGSTTLNGQSYSWPGSSTNGVLTNTSGVLSWAPAGGTGTVTNVTGIAPLSVINTSTTPEISISQANASTAGYLSASDWNTFNDKQNQLTFGNITSGSAALAVSGGTGAAVGGNVTLNVNTGTGANQLVQLDGSGRLPAVDGSLLTGLPGGGDISGVDTPAGGGLQGGVASGTAALRLVNGTATGQILKWNNVTTSWELSTDDVGGGALPSLTDGQVIISVGANNPQGRVLQQDVSVASATGNVTVLGLRGTPISATAPVLGQVLKFNAGTYVPSADNDNQNLSAGGTGTVATGETFPINISGGFGINLVEGTNVQISRAGANLTISTSGGAPTGPAGGDLAGTYPNPTIGATAATGGNLVTALNAASTGTINTARLNSGVVLETESPAAGDITGTFGTGLQLAAGSVTGTDLAANITVTTSGSITAASFSGNGVNISGLDAGNISNGTLPVARGGTGLTSFGGGLLYASGPTTIGDIGNGTPGQVLVMNSSTPTWADLPATASPANTVIRGDAAGTAQIASSIFDNGNYTAIGRNTPIGSSRFDIQASGFGANNYGGMYIQTDNSGWPFYGYSNNGGGSMWTYWNGGTGTWNVFNGGSNRLSVTNSGNVGIGTISPAGRAHISGTGSLGLVNESSNTTGTWQSISNTSTGGQIFSIISTGSANVEGAGKLLFTANSALSFTDRNILTMNHANGNVGIGTNSPNAPLQFANAVVNRKVVLWEGANNDHQFYGLGVNSGILRYQVDATVADHVFYAGSSATASNELMRIRGNGNVGIGTTTPSSRLDVSGNTLIRGNNTNAAPTVTSGLEFMTGRSNTGGLLAGQTSADVAFNWGGASGGFRHFIQTRHNSAANSNSNSIDFWLNNSTTATGSVAPSNLTPNGNVLGMSITATGIGIGTATPNASTKLHISGAGTQYLRVEGTGAFAAGGIQLDGTGTLDWSIIPQLGVLTFNRGDVNGTIENMYLMNSGFFAPANSTNPNPTLGQSSARWGTIFTTVAVNVSSDRRLKNNIHNTKYGLKEILELRPVSYSLRSDKTKSTYLGLIAQEVQELIPEIVSVGDDAEKTLGMRYVELVPILIKAIQEQQAMIDDLKKKNASAEMKSAEAQLQLQQMAELKAELAEIKKALGLEAKKK